jgi:hypothetical protein
MENIQKLKQVTFRRAIIPPDAANTNVYLLTFSDASQHLGMVAILGRVLRKCGKFSCQLLMGRSKLLTGLTIPKAELKAAVAGAVSTSVVKRNLSEKFAGQIFAIDSTVALYWISQESKPLQVGMGNAVAEVRRFSTIQEWRHVSTSCNVAGIGTRPAAVAEVMAGCAWQEGYDWMTLPIEEMPLQTAEQITLSAEERWLAAAKVRGGDIRGHAINTVVADVADRHAYSKYLVDPCRLGWSKSLRVLALVRRFITRCKEGGRCQGRPRRRSCLL